MGRDGRMILLEEPLFGQIIRAEANLLDDGIHVLITGGERTHVGAVSAAEPGKETETMTFPGHKDHFVSGPWAKALAEVLNARAVVACGIHYDRASEAQIRQILRVTDGMLRGLFDQLGG